jgi:hypothetical protein
MFRQNMHLQFYKVLYMETMATLAVARVRHILAKNFCLYVSNQLLQICSKVELANRSLQSAHATWAGCHAFWLWLGGTQRR